MKKSSIPRAQGVVAGGCIGVCFPVLQTHPQTIQKVLKFPLQTSAGGVCVCYTPLGGNTTHHTPLRLRALKRTYQRKEWTR